MSVQALTISNDNFAFNSTTGESYTLNRCACLILQRLRHGDNQEQIVQFVVQQFGIAPGMAERDVADFFQQLQALRLVGGNR